MPSKDKESRFEVNPALDPTKKWQNTPAVREDIYFLIESLSAERAAFLKKISDGQHHAMHEEEASLASFLNKASGAFGYVDMIETVDQCWILTKGVKEPLAEVMSSSHLFGK